MWDRVAGLSLYAFLFLIYRFIEDALIYVSIALKTFKREIKWVLKKFLDN